MAVAKKCDRCGKLYEFYDGKNCIATASMNKQSNGYNNDKFYDLCPECMGSYNVWFKEAKIEQKKKEYERERIAAMVEDMTGPNSTEVID